MLSKKINRVFFICVFALCWATLKGQETVPTFYQNIAPIVWENCTPCHHTGGSAPFVLETYKDVAKRASFVQFVTEQNIMPPWKANPHYRSFAGEKSLTVQEKEAIRLWVAAGAPKGKKQKGIKMPKFSEGTASLPSPDWVLSMKEPMRIEGVNEHKFISYAIPYELPNDTFVRAIEYLPGNRELLHHCSYQVLAVHESVDFSKTPSFYVFSEDSINGISDDFDFEFYGLIGKNGERPVEVFHNGWLPGASPLTYPEGMGFYLPKKGVLLIRNLHYSPTPVDATDLSKFHLYFASKPVKRVVRFAAFNPTGIDLSKEHIIKANTLDTFEMNIKINGDVSVLNINPHMHELGKYFLAYAITPSNDTLRLVEIPEWDFNWQEFYQFKKPLYIPSGSTIHAEAIYDNTVNNLSNPFDPPRDVFFERGSMTETEEMMRLTFLYIPYQKGDETIDLTQTWTPKK